MLYSHLKCLLSNVFYLIIMCFFCRFSIQLCTSISEIDAPISQSKEFKKNFTLWRRERVSSISEDIGYNGHVPEIHMLAWYVYNTIFLLNPTRMIIVHFVLWFISNVFLFFYSCYCISYNNTLESLLDEINFFHSMPNCNVTLIGNPYLLLFKSVNYTKLVI